MQDLTTGSVTRHLLKTSSFMLVTMVFQTLYFLVDLYWVGRLGKEAVAAVGVAGNLTFVVLALSQMLGVGVISFIAHGLVVVAFRHAPATTLAPLSYLEIVSATLLSYLVFSDFPEPPVWLGIAIIVGSGLYVAHRERRRAPLPAPGL